jgi:hypothetical protein
MEAWYEPDPIFSFFDKAKTRAEFAQNWVVKGRFHSKVPEDILKSYKTVEYLMAHAWYHWPMFDEALKKMLGMVEMAVKFRCKELGISLLPKKVDENDKGKKKKEKDFSVLIDQLAKAEPEKEFQKWLHDVRELRNYFAHPKDHNFTGGVAIPKIKNIINLINLIFLEEADCRAAKEKTALFEKEYADFKKGLFVLECNLGRILVAEMRLLEAFQVRDEWVYVCFFRPVLRNMLDNLTTQRYVAPPILALKMLGMKEGVFEAVDIETGSAVKVIQTTHPDDQTTWSHHQQDWAQLDLENQRLYDIYLIHSCGGKLRDFMYEYRWITPQPPSSI